MEQEIARMKEQAMELMSENYCTNDFTFPDGSVDRERICDFAVAFMVQQEILKDICEYGVGDKEQKP